jgi:hypothetical protein
MFDGLRLERKRRYEEMRLKSRWALKKVEEKREMKEGKRSELAKPPPPAPGHARLLHLYNSFYLSGRLI